MSAGNHSPFRCSPLPDDPAATEKLRDRLQEQLEAETDTAALQGAELALVALREPLEAGPVAILLRFVAEHVESAMLRQEAELKELRRRLLERDEAADTCDHQRPT